MITIKRTFVLLTVFLAGCSNQFKIGYQPEISQGNVLTTAQMQSITKGMTKEQVEYILGTPVLNNIFATDRIDYVFIRDTNKSERILMQVFFDNKNKVINIKVSNLH